MNLKCRAQIDIAIAMLKEAHQMLAADARTRRERDPRAETVHDAWIALENLLEREPAVCPTCLGWNVVKNGAGWTTPCPTCQMSPR